MRQPNCTERELLQRCLVMLEQHDRTKNRPECSQMYSGDLIEDVRAKLTKEELAACDQYVPKAHRR